MNACLWVYNTCIQGRRNSTPRGRSIAMVKLNAISVFLAVLASPVVWAAPSLEKRQAITPLSSAQIATFKPYSFFAAAAYCNPSTTRNWSCGTNCNANSDFIPVASGGDGASVQFWYVGYSPSLATVIVAHQGTDTSQIEALATDANIVRRSLNSSLFPGVSSAVGVHDGFGDEQEKTATQVLAAVNSAIAAHGAKKVTIVGHSLGAAISLIDSVYLPLHISGVTFQSFLYGMPRVGDQEFADYVDAHVHQTRITNKKDLVPIVPAVLLSLALAFVLAAPAQEEITNAEVTPNLTSLEKRETFPVSTAEVDSFRPYTVFAAIPACGPTNLLAWNCTKCLSNPQFTPVAAGGDGGVVQIWFVGYDPTLDSVIVSFQGTDVSKLLPLLTDVDLILTPLSPQLFPGMSPGILTHNGFAHAQSLSAAPVLSAVKAAMSRFHTSHVTVVGHSLGAAIAMISGVHLKVNLPSTTTFRLVTYGGPRVGNKAFADYIDSHFPNAVFRIVNKRDIVPVYPPRILGFEHAEGQLHIRDDLSWVSCPGHENGDPNCSLGYIANIFGWSLNDLNDHGGPYGGIPMGC
ncbi:hypothetical protein D9756_002148 [Leucocoprinus leucothites]|uniref:Fungal lipase-type domain-containing protein n=1 Tax=Leucocoprinus leucothites TaxID=201217 RepID=A0A8H5LLQ1_9AGAR|nr:hypothetical protein D9756_002148 [Leucoagaricus leucothites]